MLIAIVNPIMKIYRKTATRYGYTGHVINIAQNLEQFAPVLPRLVSDLPIVWLIREGKDDQFKLLQVRRRYVELALRWLKNIIHFTQTLIFQRRD